MIGPQKPARSLRRLSTLGCFLVPVLLGSPPARAVQASQGVAFVDDRGDRISGILEVCFRRDLERRCSQIAGISSIAWPEGFSAIEVQGEEHGPVRAVRSDLELSESEHGILRVARKATLRLLEVPKGLPVTVSLYRADDPTMRLPAFRFGSVPSEGLRVAAGHFVLSVSDGSSAPSLYEVVLAPGDQRSLRFTQRPGWSLALRVAAVGSLEPVERARVRLHPLVEAATDTGSDDILPAEAVSSRAGLALISGISTLYVNAEVLHPGFVPVTVRGIAATPGTFTVRETTLPRGGTLRGTVTLDGRPAVDVAYELVDLPSSPENRTAVPLTMAEGQTDQEGRYAEERLAPGAFTLRVRPGDGESHVERRVRIHEGEETQVEIELESIGLDGTVYRGNEPTGEGYRVEIIPLDGEHASGGLPDSATTATTDAEGRFRATVWEPGRYLLMLLSPGYVPITSLRTVLAAGEERQDFYLERMGIKGRVVDQAGQGVPGASVRMVWNETTHLSIGASEDGQFSFPLDSEGRAELRAYRDGYTPSEPVVVEAVAGADPPHLLLELRREETLTGTVRSSIGGSLAGVPIVSLEVTGPGLMRLLGSARSDELGHFELPRSSHGATRLAAAGLRCPLSIQAVASAGEGSGQQVTFFCPSEPAALDLLFQDRNGESAPGHSVILRRGDVVLPQSLVQGHLAGLGLAAEADATGRLVLPSLSPGTYDLFLANSSSPESIASGHPDGFLTTVRLEPYSTAEVQITVGSD